MKRLKRLLLTAVAVAALSVGSLFGQTLNTGTYYNFTNGAMVEGTDVNDRFLSLENDTVGVFNVLEFGINGTDDQVAFQAAINAAAAYGPEGGTVFAPSYDYSFSGPDTLKSDVTIIFDKNARVIVASDYTGPIFYSGDGTLQDTWIIGGYFYSVGSGYKFLDIDKDGAANTAVKVHIKDVHIYNGETAFDLYTDDGGWANGFTYSDIWVSNTKSMFKTRDPNSTGAGIDGHHFINVQYQTSDSSEIVLDSITSDNNSFTNLFIWDIGDKPTASVGVFTSTANNNSVLGGHFGSQNFSDLGTYNIVQGAGAHWVTPIADSLKVYEYNYTTGNNQPDRLTLLREGQGGADGVPGGDNAIKIYAAAANETTVGSNFATRIVAQNEQAANYSSHLKLQVHGTANDNANSAYIDAIHIDGSDDGHVTFADDITVTGTATIGGLTSGAAELSEAELEILDGATLSTTELNYVDGVTSSIQDQIDAITGEDTYILADTSFFVFGYGIGHPNDTLCAFDGAILGGFRNPQDTIQSRYYVSNWSGVGAGSGFTYDIVADAVYLDATPEITIASNKNISTNGGSNGGTATEKIPPGYWIWCEIDGTPTTKPTQLLIQFDYSKIRAY